ncbi:hypothetical protein HK405_013371 [Cladochytrium tenue]|nr:hypothetical protein HK405_013371 [Cladochytrium tenue]
MDKHSTSYLILFAHLRPILARSDIRLVFVSCHESLAEVTAFLQNFAFWLRTLDGSSVSVPGSGPFPSERNSVSSVLPGEIFLDASRKSYAFFGLLSNLRRFAIVRRFIKNNVLKATGRSHVGRSVTFRRHSQRKTISEVRFFLYVEMEAILQRHPSWSKAKYQSPGIVVMDNHKLVYKHIVVDHEKVVPRASQELASALSCTLDEVGSLDRFVENGLESFVRAVSTRETSAAVETDELEFGEQIGNGVESSVHRCRWRGVPVAVKLYRASSVRTAPMAADRLPRAALAGERNLGSFAAEAAALMALRHRNVVSVVGFGMDGRGGGPPRPFLVTELMARGSLFDVLGEVPDAELPARRKLAMLSDTARGMAFLHACRPPLLHTDLKSLNVLVDTAFVCKIADFGVARGAATVGGGGGALASLLAALRRAAGGGSSTATTAAAHPDSTTAAANGEGEDPKSATPAHNGTVHWMAPEVMRAVLTPATRVNRNADGTNAVSAAAAAAAAASTKSDVFAFGVVMWEVATRRRPWWGVSASEVCARVLAGGRLPLPQPATTSATAWPAAFVTLVSDCWAEDPARRPEFRQILTRLRAISAAAA